MRNSDDVAFHLIMDSILRSEGAEASYLEISQASFVT